MKKKIVVASCVCLLAAGGFFWQKRQADKFNNIYVYKPINTTESRGPASLMSGKEKASHLDKKKSHNSHNAFFFKSADVYVDGNFQISKTHRAVPMEQFKDDFGKPVGHFQQYVIYELSKDMSDNEVYSWNPHSLPILKNKDNGALTLLSGTLIIQVDPKQSIAPIASGFGMEVVYEAPHLGMYYLKMKKGKNFNENLAEIKNMAMVLDAQPELISSSVRMR